MSLFFKYQNLKIENLKKCPEAPLWAYELAEVPQGTSMQFETQETVFSGITTVIHESLLYLNPSSNFPNSYMGLQGLQVHTLPPLTNSTSSIFSPYFTASCAFHSSRTGLLADTPLF